MDTTTIRLPVDQARRGLIMAQGLAPGGSERIGDILERTGYVRTLGGVEAYLALRARVPNVTAGDIHGAVSAGDAQVLPAVRGCIYLVARNQAPAAMRLAAALSRPRFDKERVKAGIEPKEIRSLGEKVVDLLRREGAMTTDAIRKALPAGSVRSLGEVGKKIGMSSTLPPALRDLEMAGRIERVLEGGRLDSERYQWRIVPEETGAGTGSGAGTDVAETLEKIAEVFFRAAGMGTIKDFAEWAGVSQRDAAAAVARLDTIRVEIEGAKEPRVALAEMRSVLEGGDAARDAVAFLPFEDNLLALQGTPAMLVDPAHHGLEVPQWGPRGKASIKDSRHIQLRSVIADGKVAGFWEFDPRTKQVVYALFDAVSPATRHRLEEEANRVGRFLAEEVGHGRSFSLDTDEALAERADWVRKLAAKATKTKKGKKKMAATKKSTVMDRVKKAVKKKAKPVQKAVKKAVKQARKAVRKTAKQVAKKTR